MIHCSYDYAGNEEDEDGVTVYFRGRLDTVRCKVLVGIDGLFSGVRKSVAPFPDNGGDEVGPPFESDSDGFIFECKRLLSLSHAPLAPLPSDPRSHFPVTLFFSPYRWVRVGTPTGTPS